MTIAARLQQDQSADRRGLSRRHLRLASSLEATGHHVSIHDISPTGMLIETAAVLAPRDELEIDLPESGTTRAVVVWNSGAFFGCEFVEPLSRAGMSAALLRSSPANMPQLPLPLESGEANDPVTDPGEDHDPIDDLKAPLPVRLRVIFGSAILLWALIIWATISLVRALR